MTVCFWPVQIWLGFCLWATYLLRKVTIRREKLYRVDIFSSSIFICPSFLIIRLLKGGRSVVLPTALSLCWKAHGRTYKSKTACHSHGDSWINVWLPWLWPGQGLSCAQCLGICGHSLCTIINNAIHQCKVHLSRPELSPASIRVDLV